MERPPEAPGWLEVVTAEERPDLWRLTSERGTFDRVWPEYNRHGTHAGRYFAALFPRFARFQMLFVDRRSDLLIGRTRAIPFCWGGTLRDLPEGIDGVGLRAMSDRRRPTALSALSAEIDPQAQGRGLSRALIVAMALLARREGLAPLVAPVRPSAKDRHPLVPIERYVERRRSDGLPIDPWLRVHVRLGGRILRTDARSLEIRARVSDWELWTGQAFPGDGEHLFPGALAPLTTRGEVGTYYEPNVWMLHEVDERAGVRSEGEVSGGGAKAAGRDA